MGLLRALFEQIKSKLWPLRPTLVSSVVIIVVFTMFAIGIPSYFSARRIVKNLWGNLGSQIGSSSAEVSQLFLNTAEPAAHILHRLSSDGELDTRNKTKILVFTRDLLDAYPTFTWVAFAGANGDYTASYRLPDSEQIHGTVRTIESYNEMGLAVTKDIEMLFQDDAWVTTETLSNNYDPRLRPFWKQGAYQIKGAWSPPFADWTTGRPSFAYTLPQIDGKGSLVGVWEIEFRADYFSHFLAQLKIGRTGQAWILTDTGLIVANSKALPTTFSSVYDIKNENDPLVNAWKALQRHGERTQEFSFGDYFAYIQSLPNYTNLPWKILIIVPKADFLNDLDFQIWITVVIGFTLCLLFSLLGVFFFGHISSQLQAVANEMEELGALKISDSTFGSKETFVREVHIMNTAVDRLKIGLKSFAKYVPLDVIHNLVSSGHSAELGGRKNNMTVLFSDLGNFTDISEQLPPVRLLEILSNYFTEMGIVIQNNQGLIDKFIGDAIMAFWGAPVSLKDHAKAACLTALVMQERFSVLTEHLKISDMSILSQRIGINTGDMIVGNIGSPTRMQYTVIGDSVNLASRLEGLNKIYKTHILVNETTARLAGSQFVFRPLDWVFVKGRHQTSLVYELVGLVDKVPPHTRKAINLYEQALYLYRNREFIKASKKFEEANDAFDQKDHASVLMAERARNYVLHSPSDDWSGVFLMDEK